MQGAYNGFSTKIMDHNSEHIHIWCYSHIFNLILNEVLKENLKASNLITLITATAVFFRQSHKRRDIWIFVTKEKQKRLGTIGQTRWWSKEHKLNKIFGEIHCT